MSATSRKADILNGISRPLKAARPDQQPSLMSPPAEAVLEQVNAGGSSRLSAQLSQEGRLPQKPGDPQI